MRGNYSEFQVGNWGLYVPEGCYCTINSLFPAMILNGVSRNYHTTIDCLKKIKITQDKLQVLGFEVDYPVFTKKYNNEISVKVIFYPAGVHRLLKNEEPFSIVEFIHEVQNAYYAITGEMIQGNLYGVQER